MNVAEFEAELKKRGVTYEDMMPDLCVPSGNDRAFFFRNDRFLKFYDAIRAAGGFYDKIIVKRNEKAGLMTYYAFGQVGYAKTDVSTSTAASTETGEQKQPAPLIDFTAIKFTLKQMKDTLAVRLGFF
jgi:hypothetical protein